MLNRFLQNVRKVKFTYFTLSVSDLFYTRVHPSATFDILKDDFDHWFISVMLLGLFLATIMTKRLAKMRDLNMAWK